MSIEFPPYTLPSCPPYTTPAPPYCVSFNLFYSLGAINKVFKDAHRVFLESYKEIEGPGVFLKAGNRYSGICYTFTAMSIT